ncbi:MAG: phage terminase large subunit [Alphaproteobacteria bacterium]
MTTEKQKFQVVLRTDFYAFTKKVFAELMGRQSLQENWHLELLTHALSRCATGDETRLLVAMPPRSLKSFCASVALPLWALGKDPTTQIICVSYSDELTRKFSHQRQQVFNMRWYRDLFPHLGLTKLNETETYTTEGGQIFSTSVKGTMTGIGADLLIIDDPIKAGSAMSEADRKYVNDWYRNTAYQRLNLKQQSSVVIVSQRVHVDDLIGSVLDVDDWAYIKLQALAEQDEEYRIDGNLLYYRQAGEALHPERESVESILKQKAILGEVTYSAQLQQEPIPPGGLLFKRNWFVDFEGVGPDDYDLIMQSWDVASSVAEEANYSVCTTWGIRRNDFYLLSVFREQLAFPDLIRMIERQWRISRAHRVIVESSGLGMPVFQTLQSAQVPVTPYRPKVDKITRAEQVSAIVEQGRVHLPKHADWKADFMAEVLAFPGGRYDDQVDSMTQFLLNAEFGRRKELGVRLTGIDSGGEATRVFDSYEARTGEKCIRF